jgi:peptidoglycan/xylan/chitin deacetylase (PgdA/CDA1 family)
MYHRIGASRNQFEARYAIGEEAFRQHMRTLAESGHRAVSADALCASLGGGPALPLGSIVLTFDDGFRGVRDHALPELERLGWPSIVFLVSDLIGGVDEWTRAENPDGRTYDLLDAAEIADMQRRGVAFGSHTRSHPSLPRLDDKRLDDELSTSRKKLANLLGQEVRYLAYPFGHVDERVVTAARHAGYRTAFSTQPGFNRPGVDLFRIRRIDVFGTDTPATLMRKIRFGTNDGRMSTAVQYYLNRLRTRLPTGRP